MATETATDAIVDCRDAWKVYADDTDGSFVALGGVDLQVRRNEFVVLVGPSGCGKSTLLNLVGGFDTPTRGEIRVEGAQVRGPGPNRAMVFQEYALLPWLDARGNVELALRMKGVDRAQRRERAMEYLTLVGLGAFARRPVYKLSGGMQQRVSIARALALDPAILLMDEPFGALDAQQRGLLQEELIRIWEQTHVSILFVTHSLEEAAYLGNRVIVMGANPGHFVEELQLDLARPRDRYSDEFNAVKRRLGGVLERSLANGAAAR
jgi:NitT/TauT family transport system ATP-binding protein